MLKLFPEAGLHVCFLPRMMTGPASAEVICMRKKEKVLVHLAIVRNEEFQQLGPTEAERSEEWMSLFSPFSLSSGALLGSVHRSFSGHVTFIFSACVRALDAQQPVFTRGLMLRLLGPQLLIHSLFFAFFPGNLQKIL